MRDSDGLKDVDRSLGPQHRPRGNTSEHSAVYLVEALYVSFNVREAPIYSPSSINARITLCSNSNAPVSPISSFSDSQIDQNSVFIPI